MVFKGCRGFGRALGEVTEVHVLNISMTLTYCDGGE